MKIFQINTVYNTGSTGRIVKELSNSIIASGGNSYVAYGRGEHTDDKLYRIGTNLDMIIHGIQNRLLDNHGLISKNATRRFISKIKSLDIDIYHLHNIHGYYANYPELFNFLKMQNKPVVWTFHDCWPFTGHCAYYDYAQCEKWKTECFSCSNKNNYPASLLLDNSRKNYRFKKEYFTLLKDLTIVTPSNWLAGEVKMSFFKEYETKVIHNGIDLDIFKPRDSDFRKKNGLLDKFLILGVANVWEERKGYNFYIELSKQLNDDEKIVLIGLSAKQLKSLPPNILGIARTESQKELAEIYTAADLFFNPTLEEVLGLTNLESLACGTPVLTFNSGGSPETVDRETGIVIPKEDMQKTLQAIKTIKKNGKKSFSKDCIKRASLFFDKNERFQEYIKLYRNLLKK